FLRTLGWRKTAEAEVEAMDEVTRGYYEAYAEGVNAYLSSRSGAELSLEYAVLGLQNPDYEPEPWEPADSVAWLKAMAWDLRTNVEDETERALLAGQLAEDPDTDVNGLLGTLYPDYPFDRNPVIVPKISTVAPLETSVEPAAFTGPAD
ncbi:penicillin acylase family protein, partial [Mycobacterium tuberculosis]|uniref:penicillin acylase family protein n=1 Tax=Mycobacterium tuberculosis TaxID=1773 RepID=UPI000AF1FDE0